MPLIFNLSGPTYLIEKHKISRFAHFTTIERGGGGGGGGGGGQG